MDRRVLLSAMAVFALTVGCATAPKIEPAPPAPPPPAPAPSVKDPECPAIGGKKEHGKYAVIVVDKDGKPDVECLDIKFKNTAVIWIAGADVDTVQIVFKNVVVGETPPNPDGPAAACVLPRKSHKGKGSFDYEIVVVRDDRTTAAFDPKLIINP